MSLRTKFEQKEYDVLIATPGRMVHAEYVQSLVATTELLNDLGITYKFLNKYSSFVPSARELTATDTYHHNWDTRTIGAGKYRYNKIIWIDSDVEWDPNDFYRLYESEHDIISGLVQTDPGGTVGVNYPDPNGVPTHVNKVEFLLHSEPVEVGGVGFGFVAMRYGVFETMERPWFKIRDVQLNNVEYRTNMGEDYSWCESAREAGFKIMVDPMIKLRHHKETVFEV